MRDEDGVGLPRVEIHRPYPFICAGTEEAVARFLVVCIVNYELAVGVEEGSPGNA